MTETDFPSVGEETVVSPGRVSVEAAYVWRV